MINPEHFGTLVVAGLNVLWSERCCPKCCAPCHVLHELLDAGRLRDAVQMAPEQIYSGSAWWTDRNEVDEEWLRSRWGCQARPECVEEETEGVGSD